MLAVTFALEEKPVCIFSLARCCPLSSGVQTNDKRCVFASFGSSCPLQLSLLIVLEVVVNRSVKRSFLSYAHGGRCSVCPHASVYVPRIRLDICPSRIFGTL